MIDLSEHKIYINGNIMGIKKTFNNSKGYRWLDLDDLINDGVIKYRCINYGVHKSKLNEVLNRLGYKVKDTNE